MKRIAAVAVMAALMSVSLVAVATAHTVKHDSRITLQVKENGLESDTFEGKVLSDSDKCVAGRFVRIYRVQAGEDDKITVDGTNVEGEYSAPAGELAAGTYYAVVIRKFLLKNDEHTHVCRRAVSPERMVAGGPGN